MEKIDNKRLREKECQCEKVIKGMFIIENQEGWKESEWEEENGKEDRTETSVVKLRNA